MAVGTELDLAADALLDADRKRFYATVQKAGSQYLVHDILSPGQLEMRTEREVYATGGTVDAAVLRGMYRRVFNPKSRNLPSRRKFEADPWRQREVEFYDNGVAGAWIPSARRSEITGGMHFLPGVTSWSAWPDFTRPRHVYFLDRFQRCRIRAAVRKDVSLLRRRELAALYGVPTWVIYRLATTCP